MSVYWPVVPPRVPIRWSEGARAALIAANGSNGVVFSERFGAWLSQAVLDRITELESA